MDWRRHIRDPREELRRMDDWMNQMFRETWPYYLERKALPRAAGEEVKKIEVNNHLDVLVVTLTGRGTE
jgi:hypothetical protein